MYMEITVETIESHTTVVTDRKVECFILGEKVVIYRLTVTTTSGNKKPTTSVSEGITSPAGLSSFRNGAASLPEFFKNQSAVLGNPELVETLRTYGYLNDEFREGLREITNTPYTRWAAGGAKIEDIILFEGGAHMCHDWQGVPLACAMPFNYIEAQLHNGSYDLKKALEILKKRTDIRFYAQDRWSKAEEIQMIPGYNQTERNTECISFVWMPLREDYLRMWSRAQGYGGTSHPSCNRYRAVFDEDLLGLRAGGSAKFLSFYGRVSDEEEES